MWLAPDTFRTVVASTPLISIDLLVKNIKGELLLGCRSNRPAQGYWFVPGGRVLKNETLDDAFRRITFAELGRIFDRQNARFIGVYEHFYKDSIFSADEGPDTHYVVLGYSLVLLDDILPTLPKAQHEHFCWWDMQDMASSPDVHDNTRGYLLALQ